MSNVFALCKENRKHLIFFFKLRNTKCFVELNSSAKCTAGNFFFFLQMDIEIKSVMSKYVRPHTWSGGQMASAVCQRPRHSLSSPQDPSNSK